MSEYQVTSFVVHCKPEQTEYLNQIIIAIKGAEVPIFEPGKIVVVVESDNRQELVDIFEYIKSLPHVIASLFVFHQTENDHSDIGITQ